MLYDGPPANPEPSTSSHDAKEEGEKVTENFRINHIVALTWATSGSRRVRGVDDMSRLRSESSYVPFF